MTVDEIRALRDAAYQAYLDALNAHSLSFGGVNNRSVTRQDISKLRDDFLNWDQRLKAATGQGRKQYSLVRFRSH